MYSVVVLGGIPVFVVSDGSDSEPELNRTRCTDEPNTGSWFTP